MQNLTIKDVLNGKGFISYAMRDNIKELNLNDDTIVVNFAYTDYGGDFFDKVAIEYFSIIQYSNCFIVENTCYYGKNAVLFGSVAKDFIEATKNYPLGYDDIEDFYSNMEREAQIEQAKEFLNDYKDEDNNKLSDKVKDDCLYIIIDKLSEHSILSSGTIDICESELEDTLNTFLNGDYKMILSKNR